MGGTYAWAAAAPQSFFVSAVNNIEGVENFHMDLSFSASAEGVSVPIISGAFSGDFSTTNGALDAQGNFDIIAFSTITNFDIKKVGDSGYVRLNSFPFAVLIGRDILDTWFSVSLNELAAAAETTADTDTLADDMGPETLFEQGVFSFVGVPLPVWGQNGPALRYTVAIDKQKYNAQILEETFAKPAYANADPTLKAFVADVLNGFDIGPITYDVSLWRRIVDHVEVPMHLALSDQTRSLFNEIGPGPYHGLLTLSIRGVGHKVIIEAPAESRSIVDEINLERARSADARAVADVSSARVGAEFYYMDHGSYSGFCTSAEGKAYLNISQNGVAPTCRASGEQYVIFTQLSNQLWACADARGTATSTLKSFPVGMICK